MQQTTQLSDEQVARLRGTPPGETFQWVDGRGYRVESNDADQLVAYSVPYGLKLTVGFDEKAQREPFAIGVGPKPKTESLSEAQLGILRSLRVGDLFSQDGKLCTVRSRRPGQITATPQSGGPAFTITWGSPVGPPEAASRAPHIPTARELELERMADRITEQTIRQIRAARDTGGS